MTAALRAGLLALPLLLAACVLGDPAPSDSSDDESALAGGAPTFTADVQPILARRCEKCHQTGGIAPFSLTTYEQARAMAPAMVEATAARRMPPWGAQDTPECAPPLPWRDDERLTADELRILRAWDAAGAPEGQAPVDGTGAPAKPGGLALVDPTYDVTPRAPFTASGARDQFRCFVLDTPGLEYGGYISAIHVLPGNPKVVHHVNVFTDPGGVLTKLAGPDGSYDCGPTMTMSPNGQGEGDLSASVMLEGWAPGSRPLDLPANIAIPVPPGSRIMMQIHYSPRGRTAAPDLTRVQIKVGSSRPEYALWTASVGNYLEQFPNGDGLQPGPNDRGGVVEFRVPANVRDHIERMRSTVTQDFPMWLYGVRAHEHLAGVDVKVELEQGGARQCLLQDKWDFHWQRVYSYSAPAIEALPALRFGDKLHVRCTYDNTMSNPRLAEEYRARGLVPMDLSFGNETLDEMCFANLYILSRTD